MGGMFVFNLDFNIVDWYPECEQMRYYSIADRPAEAALTAMSKNPVLPVPRLDVSASSIAAMIAEADQPITGTLPVLVSNTGSLTLTWSAQTGAGEAFVPTFTPISGTLAAGQSRTLSVTWSSTARPIGLYTGTLTLSASPSNTLDAPKVLPLTLFVVDQVYPVYLPLTVKSAP
jgi:hypothetical protein